MLLFFPTVALLLESSAPPLLEPFSPSPQSSVTQIPTTQTHQLPMDSVLKELVTKTQDDVHSVGAKSEQYASHGPGSYAPHASEAYSVSTQGSIYSTDFQEEGDPK